MAWKVRKGGDREGRNGEDGADRSLLICSAKTGNGGPLQPSSVHHRRPEPRTCLRVKSQTPPTPFLPVLARPDALRGIHQPPGAQSPLEEEASRSGITACASERSTRAKRGD